MLTPYCVQAIQDHQNKKIPQPASRYLRSRPTMYTQYKTTRRRKDPSLKVPTLTPYYAHVIQDHMKKKRPQPQGTHAHAQLRPRPTRPPEEDKTPASRYLRSRPTTYTAQKTARRRKDRTLNLLMLRPYYEQAIQDHQNKQTPKPQGTYAHALLCIHHTEPPEEEKPKPQGVL